MKIVTKMMIRQVRTQAQWKQYETTAINKATIMMMKLIIITTLGIAIETNNENKMRNDDNHYKSTNDNKETVLFVARALAMSKQ